MWLTRSFKPFIFKNNYTNDLPFKELDNLGLYVHIPFCRSICNFCPYCKVLYSKDLCDKYIDYLIKEINFVGSKLDKKKKVTSLYFGGGSPALAIDKIKKIINTINKYFIITEGIGIELHPEDVNVENLKALKDANVTKISIGIQSFNEKYQHILGRKPLDCLELRNNLSKVKFETVSIDLIFALPNQTYNDLKEDINIALSIGSNHIAIYPFIDFTFTKSKIKTMEKKEKKILLDNITNYLLKQGLVRNSIWTFATKDNASYSSMTRDNFLGFGCSATTLLKNQFKINTFSIEEYIKRIDNNNLPTSLTIDFTKRQRMIYYLFWTLYSTKINSLDFENFFGIPLKKVYGFELYLAKKLGFLTEENNIYSMTLKGAFYYHYYENFYTLSYIDKMWNIMKNEAFPKNIKL